LLVLGACQNPPLQEENSEQKEQTTETIQEWKELEDFHMILATTFHPMEEGDFKPIKSDAGQLDSLAQKLHVATPPQGDADAIKKLTLQLSTSSRALADTIAKGADEATIEVLLTQLHDQYHHIDEIYYPR